jgi:hypothetical protein
MARGIYAIIAFTVHIVADGAVMRSFVGMTKYDK